MPDWARMVTSSPRPNARAITSGVTNPGLQIQAIRADNAQTGMRFEFARVYSEALSAWLPAPTGTPDYQPPYLGMSVPPGSSIEVEYRGANKAGGYNSPWSSW